MATSPVSNRGSSIDLDAVRSRIVPAHQAMGPLKACFWGRNKTGKTRLAGSSSLHTLIVDCREQGMETVRTRPNVEIYAIQRYPEIDEVYWLLKSGQHDFEVVVIDTISMLATLCMKWVLGDRSLDPMAKPQMPDKKHWNQITQALENVILDWRDLPMHVIFLAQERTFTIGSDDEGETISEIGPSLSPAAMKTLVSAVGTIGRTYVEEVEKTQENGPPRSEVEYRVLFGPKPPHIVGTRIGGVPPVVKNLNLDSLLAQRAKAGEQPVETVG